MRLYPFVLSGYDIRLGWDRDKEWEEGGDRDLNVIPMGGINKRGGEKELVARKERKKEKGGIFFLFYQREKFLSSKPPWEIYRDRA